MRLLPALFVAASAACAVDVDVAGPTNNAPAGSGDDGDAFVFANDGADDDGSDDDAVRGDDAGSDVDDDGSDDGSDDGQPPAAPEPPGPPPAEAAQSCGEWQDCGPWFADRNNGFDCVDGQCICDANDTYDQACADLGGIWSAVDCFCFVNASPMPSEDPNEWTADDESYDDGYDDENTDPRADRVCWWRWRETCDPDRWVDTSSYEYTCNGDDCGYEYEESGYWESGTCRGYWLRRCDDGTEKRY